MPRHYDENNGDWTERDQALFEATRKRVLNGRPALRSFRELEAALLWLPAHRLVHEDVCDGQDVCAVGAFALWKQVAAGKDGLDYLDLLARWQDLGEYDNIWYTGYLAEDNGMSHSLGLVIADANDWFPVLTPEARYDAVLAWTRRHIARLEAKHGKAVKR